MTYFLWQLKRQNSEDKSMLGAAYLDESPNHSEAGEAEVLEGARLAHGVEERVQEQWDVGWRTDHSIIVIG